MVYHSNGDARSVSFTGAGLAQHVRHLSAAQRACLAADIVEGRAVLHELTLKTVAAVACVSPAYVHAALRLSSSQRAEVKNKQRPLIQPAWPRPSSVPEPLNWDDIDDAALVDAIRAIGIDRMLEAATAVEQAHI